MGLSADHPQLAPPPLRWSSNDSSASLLRRNTISAPRPPLVEGVVTWLPQMHENQVVKESAPDQQSLVLERQFKIARYLLAHSSALVLTEGLAYTLTREGNKAQITLPAFVERDERLPQELAAERLKHQFNQFVTRTCFPHGIPEELRELSPQQRRALVQDGAALTLFYLGALNEIYPTSYPQLERRASALSDRLREAHAEGRFLQLWNTAEVQSLVFEEREAALERMLSLAKADAARRNKQVIYIFGADHPPSAAHTIIVPPEFEGDIGARVLEKHRERQIRIVANSVSSVSIGVLAFVALIRRRQASIPPRATDGAQGDR